MGGFQFTFFVNYIMFDILFVCLVERERERERERGGGSMPCVNVKDLVKELVGLCLKGFYQATQRKEICLAYSRDKIFHVHAI